MNEHAGEIEELEPVQTMSRFDSEFPAIGPLRCCQCSKRVTEWDAIPVSIIGEPMEYLCPKCDAEEREECEIVNIAPDSYYREDFGA